MKIHFISIFSIACFFAACKSDTPTFELVPPSHSNVGFNNTIIENDSVNPFDLTNIYNGAGVGIADFDNNGLADIYFAGNQVSCRLYLNEGEMKFRDVTEASKVEGQGKWCRGAAVVDINNDGLQDIYVCATISPDAGQRKNVLYVNQGNNKDGVPVFIDLAAEYGLDDDSHSTMASFFDYDNDGDLDVYITVNEIVENYNPSVYRKPITDGSWPSTGRLYQNNHSDSAGHAVFTNVSFQAGITFEGYGHSACIADINRDGWKDIFVANDFLSNDILYINNQNGTFTNKITTYFKHTSANGMGSDLIDINNDGLSDLVEMDMDPPDNLRKKVLMSGYKYLDYQNNDLYGYQYQYVRNTLQLNFGSHQVAGDSMGDPTFGDIGYYAGITSTDWSWAPVVQDFDNDGFRDMIITNGFPKDVTDHDFIAYRQRSFTTLSKKEVLDAIPMVKIKNYAFKNTGKLRFADVTDDWGFSEKSFSNGAAYADLDNDGDLDIVISNINDKAYIYKNNTVKNDESKSQFLSVKLAGDTLNKQGIGAWVEIFYNQQHQVLEFTPYRGFLSSMQPLIHFGLGDISVVDSVHVTWPDNKQQTVRDVPAGQTLELRHKDAISVHVWEKNGIKSETSLDKSEPLFKDISAEIKVDYLHTEKDFIDFNIQKLIPHKLSEYTPALATGDINGDGFQDLVVGGSSGNGPALLFQQASGTFIQKNLVNGPGNNVAWEAVGITLFDADGDKDQDLYIACGSNEMPPGSAVYRDRFYINDGKGNFREDSLAIPENLVSKSVVRVSDFDKDGDPDMFVGGRCFPWNYPMAVSSMLLRNDSHGGNLKFTNITDSIAAGLNGLGMVCDAVWSDFDNDGWADLLIAGEWMPLKILKNVRGKFKDVSGTSGINDKSGWWSSITSGDFDKDGDEDFVVGNLGENSFYKASENYPVTIYANDFYKQNTVQCLVTLYLPGTANGPLKEFTAHNRDDVVDQLPFIKKRFLTYAEFGKATFDQLFTADELKNVVKYKANYFTSVFLRNEGNGKFSLSPLPSIAQLSALNGMVADDFDNDGNLDVCISTNDFGSDPSTGRYDALNGLVLKGNGKGGFTPLSSLQSGFYVPGNGKALARLTGAGGRYLLVASQNRGALKLFSSTVLKR